MKIRMVEIDDEIRIEEKPHFWSFWTTYFSFPKEEKAEAFRKYDKFKTDIRKRQEWRKPNILCMNEIKKGEIS